MDNGAIAEYLNIRRCPANMVAWKDIAAELDMTISQLEYWRRKNDWVDKYPPSQVVSRRSQSLSIVDGEVSSALSRGLLANLPLTSILHTMPDGMDRHDLWRWRREQGYEDPRRTLVGAALDYAVRETIEHRPNSGEVMVRSYLSAAGVTVTREDLRNSIRRVDPDGC